MDGSEDNPIPMESREIRDRHGHMTADTSLRSECFEERAHKILIGAARALDREHQSLLQDLEEQNKRLHFRVQSLSQEVSSMRRRVIGDVSAYAEVVVDVDTGLEDSHSILPTNGTKEAVTPELAQSKGSVASTPALVTEKSKSKVASRAHPFQLLADWQDSTDLEENFRGVELAEIAHRRYHAGLNALLDEHPKQLTTMRLKARSRSLILDPASQPRIVWDMLAGFVLSTEICLIPMAVFDVPEDGALFVLTVAMMMYWTFDIPSNFMVGFHKADGEVVFGIKRIACRYMKSWFCLDILLVLTDWLTTGMKLFTGSEGGSFLAGAGLLRVGKMARLIRLVRVLRIVRLGKMRGIIQHMQDMIDMENTAIMFSIAKNLAIIVLINHFMACAWFFVGKQNVQDGWLETRLSDKWYRNYLISIHWSIANFTPGSSPVQPVATTELMLAVVILFFALVVFSVFVSSTTSLISRLVGLQSQRNKQLWILKGFLRQHKFDVELRDRVLRYVQIALGARKDAIQMDDVELLGLLSQPLREEVQMNLHSRTLNVHPFFKFLSSTSSVLMRKICVEALVEVSFSRGDQIFNIGEVNDKMGIVCHGVLGYNSAMGVAKEQSLGDNLEFVSTKTVSADGEAGHRLLREKDTYCEAVLWTSWHCRGLMQADADCNVVEVIGFEFRKNVKKYHFDATVIKRYAEAFIIVLNMAQDGVLESGEPLDDLQGNFLFEAPIQEILDEPWMMEATESDGSIYVQESSY